MSRVEYLSISSLMNIYGMEGKQFEEVKFTLNNKKIDASIFYIGEYNGTKRYIEKTEKKKDFLHIMN